MKLLLEQYELVQGSRNAVLSYLETLTKEDLNKGIKEFNNTSIANLITHVANCYIFWLATFAMHKEANPLDRISEKDIGEIRSNFGKADIAVGNFLEQFKNKLEPGIKGNVKGIEHEVIATPFELFTHTITHEFHHKGQIMTMSRMLGYTPPDTDIIRFV